MMPRRFHRAACTLLLLFATGAVLAQQGDADTVLQRVADTADAIEDATFLLTGRMIDADGTELTLEIEVQVVPGSRAASAYILQPDALADNIIVLDGDAVYNYTFMTHQVTIFDADDPDALGGLLGDSAGGDLAFSFDLDRVFAGYEAEWLADAETPHGPAEVVRMVNVDEEANLAWVDITVPEATGLPYHVEMYQGDGTLLAELTLENLRTDVGLDPEEVTYLPEDAEVIDERSGG